MGKDNVARTPSDDLAYQLWRVSHALLGVVAILSRDVAADADPETEAAIGMIVRERVGDEIETIRAVAKRLRTEKAVA